jgi:ABC-2 type transport system ATP-binding protein
VRTVVRALDGVDFTIMPGATVGYIGANGAGKSTTIKLITGILQATAGTVRTFGLDPMRHRREVSRRVGVVFGQRSQLWSDLPLAESFTILAAVHRLSPSGDRVRREELVARLELGHLLAVPVRQLSRRADAWRADARLCCTPPSCWCSTSRPSGWTC